MWKRALAVSLYVLTATTAAVTQQVPIHSKDALLPHNADVQPVVAARDDIDIVIDRMSAEQQVGQLLIVSFDGAGVDRSLREMVNVWCVGGVVFYKPNLISTEQTRSLTKEIRVLATEDCPAPFLAIDQEGGSVQRFRSDAASFPSHMAFGAVGSPQLTHDAAFAMGMFLRDLGFNMNFAPVLDLLRNSRSALGTRSFGDSPEAVARLGAAFVAGQTQSGVVSVGKHFVAEGSAGEDTHASGATVRHPPAQLRANDLVPFRRAIGEGLPAIMTSHVAVPAPTPKAGRIPSTLSTEVLTGVLRSDLAFDGLIITDAIEMPAARESGLDIGEIALLAVEAGADMVLTAGTGDDRRKVYARLLAARRSGRLSAERLRASLRRILRAKSAYASVPRSQPSVGVAAIASDVASKAVTIVWGGDRLPLEHAAELTYAGPAGPLACLGNAGVVWIDGGDAGTIAQQLCAIPHTGPPRALVLAFTNRVQAASLAALYRTAVPRPFVVAVALGNPADLALVDDADVAVATYGQSDASQQAALDMLRGRVAAAGRLPLTSQPFRSLGQRASETLTN